MKKRRKIAIVRPPRVYLAPRSIGEHQRVSEFLMVGPIAGKANEPGVRTKVALAPNTRLFYFGTRIDQDELDELKGRATNDNKLVAYIASAGVRGWYIDAHPRPGRQDQ
jgi:hypothetical protein